MRALWLSDRGLELREDLPPPQAGTDETLVRVTLAGICETDLQLIQGYLQFRGIIGHEFVGVAETGPWRGQRVVGEINCGCSACSLCKQGEQNHCTRRTVLGIVNRHGAFAEYLVLPQRNLHLVPDNITDQEAVLTEPLAAAFRITEQILLQPHHQIVILGDGRLAQLCVRVLQLFEVDLLVIGKHPSKLELLHGQKVSTALRSQIIPDHRADIVIDATGSPTGLADAIQWVRPRGTIVLKTTVAAPHTINLAPIVINEVQVIGSRCGPFPRAIQALQDREIDVAPLIQGTYPLSRSLELFESLRESHLLKVLLDPTL